MWSIWQPVSSHQTSCLSCSLLSAVTSIISRLDHHWMMSLQVLVTGSLYLVGDLLRHLGRAA